MGVDGTKPLADSGLVALGAAIKEALDGRSQRWLADALDADPSVVTRIIKGQVKDLTVERVRQIEDALDLPRGALFAAGGYTPAVSSPEEAIAFDLSLPRAVRDALIAAVVASRRG